MTMNPSARTGAARATRSVDASRRRRDRMFTFAIWRETEMGVSEAGKKFVKKM
jgi:hypothetical protein